MKILLIFREPVNGLTHFIGALLSILALVVLINTALNPLRPYHLISFSIFGIGMIILYTTSTLYHWLKLDEQGILKLRKADHIMIFIYIASTYTPVCMIVLKNNYGWALLVLIWSIALIGLFVKLFWMNAPRWLSTAIYILMGWLAVIVIYPLLNSLQLEALIWLFVGGLFYTLGAVIYALKKPDPMPGILGFHEIFHLLVMLGSFSHFWLMYRYISFIN